MPVDPVYAGECQSCSLKIAAGYSFKECPRCGAILPDEIVIKLPINFSSKPGPRHDATTISADAAHVAAPIRYLAFVLAPTVLVASVMTMLCPLQLASFAAIGPFILLFFAIQHFTLLIPSRSLGWYLAGALAFSLVNCFLTIVVSMLGVGTLLVALCYLAEASPRTQQKLSLLDIYLRHLAVFAAVWPCAAFVFGQFVRAVGVRMPTILKRLGLSAVIVGSPYLYAIVVLPLILQGTSPVLEIAVYVLLSLVFPTACINYFLKDGRAKRIGYPMSLVIVIGVQCLSLLVACIVFVAILACHFVPLIRSMPIRP
jgi:hypothetical protein